ncbi:MAG: NHL repeat-containing protein, partial [Thermomicrobiales bacterium]
MVGATTTRRRGLAVALGAMVAGWTGREAAAIEPEGGPSIEGPCGNGSARDNKCKRNNQCCTGHCDKKKGRCRCLQASKSCTQDKECCNKLTCSGGICVSGKPCTAKNCPDGCCAGDVCRGGTISEMCGKGGEACDQCKKGSTCRSQVCKPCDGCIDDETCKGGDAEDACGVNGVACAVCSGATDSCVNGACRCGAGAACSGATPECVNGACVECATDSNCPASEYCVLGVCQTCPQPCTGSYPYCVQGVCAMCRTTNDCAGVTTCNNNACCGTWKPTITFGSAGSGASQFTLPPGVAVYPYSGTLVAAVADGASVNNRVDLWGRTKGVWNRDAVYNRTGEFGLNQPYDVSVSLTYGIFMCDTGNNRIVVVDEYLQPVTAFGSHGNGDEEFITPRGVFVDDNTGYAYVADFGNDRISVWAPDVKSGRYLFETTFGSSGAGADELNGPYGVSVDGNGNIYVADSENSRISVWRKNGKNFSHVENFGSLGSDDDEFNHPFGVFAAPDGRVFVTDTANQRFSVWKKKSGVWVNQGVFGTIGDGTGEFANPFKLAMLEAFSTPYNTPKVDTVWVADTG